MYNLHFELFNLDFRVRKLKNKKNIYVALIRFRKYIYGHANLLIVNQTKQD